MRTTTLQHGTQAGSTGVVLPGNVQSTRDSEMSTYLESMLRTQEGTEERTFGVEIEFSTCNRRTLDRELAQRGLRMVDASSTHNGWDRTGWTLKHDGSCGLELVSPPLSGDAGLDATAKALEALREAGAYVNTQCGLHVHWGASDYTARDFENLVALYATCEADLLKVLHASRARNDYARQVRPCLRGGCTPATFAQDGTRGNVSRYYALNLAAYPRHGTVEFRAHHGTLKTEQVLAWVHLTAAMMERAKHGRRFKLAKCKDAHALWRKLGMHPGWPNQPDPLSESVIAHYMPERRHAVTQ